MREPRGHPCSLGIALVQYDLTVNIIINTARLCQQLVEILVTDRSEWFGAPHGGTPYSAACATLLQWLVKPPF